MNKRRHYQAYLAERPFFFAPVRGPEADWMQAAGASGPATLDLGCGDGFFASLIADTPFTIGFDPDEASVRKAARTGAYQLALAGDATRMPFADASFDSVMSNSVLEHIPDVDAVLAELKRVVRPGGRLLLSTPSHRFGEMLLGSDLLRGVGLNGLARAYTRWFNRRARHFHTDNVETWRERLDHHGFTIQRWHYYVSRPGLHAFDLAHYVSVPRLISYRLTGRWTLTEAHVSRWLAERWLGQYCETKPHDEGAYLFMEAVKKETAGNV